MRWANLRRINFPLVIGSILLLILLITSFYPDFLASADPYGKQRLEYQSDKTGQSTFLIPPVPPSPEYPWGTDHMGRDLRSLIIYGCKITMLIAVLAALGRMVIALPFAIAGAYKNKAAIWFIKQFNILFNAFPLILIVLIMTKLQLLTDFLTSEKLIMALLLTLFGWSKIANVLMEKVADILNQDFIEGEIAIGKSKLEIAVQNVIPHMIPTLIVFFFLEVALVLQTMAQIGIFALIASGGFYNAEGEANIPFEFDWASLLPFAYMFFGTDKMYLVIYPAAAFAVSIIGFNLFGEGLRMEFEKRTSRVITFIRRIPSYVSPFRLAYEIKNIEVYRKTVFTKLVCYILVLIILFFPTLPSTHKFDAVEAFQTIEELGSDKYKGRLAGSPENKELAEYIASELQSYGLQPYDGKYIHEFNIESSINVKHSTLKLKSALQGEKELVYRKDYYVTSPITFSGKFETVKLTVDELYDVTPEKFEELRSQNIHTKFVLIDLLSTRDYRRMMTALQFIINHLRPRGVIFLDGWEIEGNATKAITVSKAFEDAFIISISKEAGNELLRMGSPEIEVSVETETFHNTKGYNVMGTIPGTNPQGKTEYFIIGSKLDYVGDDKDARFPGALEAGGVAAELEIAKKLAQSGIKPQNNIMFAFWDGSFNESRGTAHFVKKYVLPGDISKITYFDIGNLAIEEEADVLMDTSRIFPKNKEAQHYINILKSNAKKHDIKLVYGSITSPIMVDMTSTKIQAFMVNNTETKRITTTSQDTVDMIDKKQYKRIGQMLMDTVIDMARGK